MIVTAILDPSVLDKSYFHAEAYRLQVKQFIRGISANGLLLADHRKRLLGGLLTRIEELPTSTGEELGIRIVEMLKKGRRRIIVCGNFKGSDELDVCRSIKSQCPHDVFITTPENLRHYQSQRTAESSVILSLIHI